MGGLWWRRWSLGCEMKTAERQVGRGGVSCWSLSVVLFLFLGGLGFCVCVCVC